jgi:HAD superfamily hydrolase (TIGR01509 family)
MNSHPELIIFDCDGVLVDSERVANEVFAGVLREVCGLEFSLEEMFDTFVGHSKQQCLDKIEAMTGAPPPEELERRYREDINQALADTVQAVPGIEAVLQQLRLPFCVASSGSHEKMRMTLGRTGLFDYFDGNIFSTSEVERGKPHPDIYLYAAKRMGVADPARCLVVEDSPLGVTGAVAAGMRVYGFAELMPAHKLRDAGAHEVFGRMSDLPTLIPHSFWSEQKLS